MEGIKECADIKPRQFHNNRGSSDHNDCDNNNSGISNHSNLMNHHHVMTTTNDSTNMRPILSIRHTNPPTIMNTNPRFIKPNSILMSTNPTTTTTINPIISSTENSMIGTHTLSSPRCPRCDSSNTKFCYYNNYSSLQPRHFCKSCRRYWTKGGSLRNVPIGGACRKNHKTTNRNVNLLISAQLHPNHSTNPLISAQGEPNPPHPHPNNLINSSQLYLNPPNDAPPIFHLVSNSESTPNLGSNHLIKHANRISRRLFKDPDDPPHLLINDPITKSNHTNGNNEEIVNTNHHDHDHYYGIINNSNRINWNFML